MTAGRLPCGAGPVVAAALLGALAACDASRAPEDGEGSARKEEGTAPVSSAETALAGAHIPTLDPVTMAEAEVEAVLGEGPRCTFRYTSDGQPILGFRVTANSVSGEGVVKLNGHLVPLAVATEPGMVRAVANGLLFSLSPVPEAEPDEGQRLADLIFEAQDSLRVGYRGYHQCLD